jgi:RHS repeat-associated protein
MQFTQFIITSKSDVGTYSYGAAAGPHALTGIATCTGCTVNGQANPSFTYDANGSMTGGANRTATYTASGMTATVSSGSTTMALSYDPGHGRTQQVTTSGTNVTTTLYFNDPASNVMAERVYPAIGSTIWKTYILADGHIVAQRTVQGATTKMRYFILDHLGSVSVITDETGAVIAGGRQSYDAWGKERNADGTPDTSCALPAASATTRGYTGQEEMQGVCLINYNARLYDPQIGRFMGADGTVEAPYSTQDWNRYTYVGNNPLSFSDPSGQCFLGCFWKSPIGRAAIAVVVFVLLQQEWALPAVFADTAMTADEIAIVSAGIGGGVSGYIATGKLGGAITGALEAAAYPMFGSPLAAWLAPSMGVPLSNFIAYGFVGGISSAAEGHGLVSGFLSAGFGSLAGEPNGNFGENVLGTMEAAALGGVGSALGGGKFANGAITGAFAYAAQAASQSEHVVSISGSRIGDTADDGGGNAPFSRQITHAEYDFIPVNGYGNGDDAAQGGLQAAHSLNNPLEELGGGIIQIGDHYWPTAPVGRGIGFHFSASVVVPPGGHFFGLYHTQPDGADSMFFSKDDVDKARTVQGRSYIGLYRDNSIRVFDPTTMRPEVVSDGGLKFYGASRGDLLCSGCFGTH